MNNKRRVIKEWSIVNWHYILNRDKDYVLFKCGRCWSIATKNRANLYKNDWCSNCAKANQQLDFSLRTKCWMLWLYLPTIKSRIQRWWSMTEALYQDKRVHKESFNEKDFKYIGDYREKHFELDEALAKKVEIKSKITKFKT